MTANSLPQPSELVEAVEAYISELPERRRRKRTRAEIIADRDQSPEIENYAPVPEPPHVIELDDDALERLTTLLFQLGRARGDAVARITITMILDLLGLELEDGK